MLVPTATRPPILPLPGPSGRRVVSLDLEADLAPKRILRVPCSRSSSGNRVRHVISAGLNRGIKPGKILLAQDRGSPSCRPGRSS